MEFGSIFWSWKRNYYGCYNCDHSVECPCLQIESAAGRKLRPEKQFIGVVSRPTLPRFSLAEIELATHSFDEAFLIGKGGFGKVYKGMIDHGESTVAIKRLDSRSKQGASEFWTEINMLSRFRHCHLVSLIGYCDEFQEMILVYEYVPSGNLSDHLHRAGRSDGDAPLSWVQPLKICIGPARALDYLHTGTCIKNRVILWKKIKMKLDWKKLKKEIEMKIDVGHRVISQLSSSRGSGYNISIVKGGFVVS